MNGFFNSFFVLGFLLVIGILVIFILRFPFIFKIALRLLYKNKYLFLLITLGSIFPSFFIGNAIVVNDSLIKSRQDYINAKLGDTKAIIYSRDEFKLWSLEETNKIFSFVGNDFDKFLPILKVNLSLKTNNNLISQNRATVISFDKTMADGYREKNTYSSIDIKDNECIITKSISNELNINKNADVEIIGLGKFKVANIIDDDGLIGFNDPRSSKSTMEMGSIFVNKRIIHDFINKSDKNDSFNAILLDRKGDYDSGRISRLINEKLIKYDSNLYFEELNISLHKQIEGNLNNINPGQTIMFISILPIIAGILLIIVLLNFIWKKNNQLINQLRLSGFTGYRFFLLYLISIVIITLFSSFVGSILSIPVAILFLNFFESITSTKIIGLQLGLNLSFASFVYAFIGSWFITVISIILIHSQQERAKLDNIFKPFLPITKDKLTIKKVFFLGLTILITLILFIYSVEKITNNIIKSITILVALVTFTIVVGNLLKYKYRKQFINLILSLILIVIVLLITQIPLYKNLWNTIPALYIINTFILLFALCLLFSTLLTSLSNILLKVFGFSKSLKRLILIGIKLNSHSIKSEVTSTISISFIILTFLSLFLFQNFISASLNNNITENEINIVDELGKNSTSKKISNYLDNNKDILKKENIRIGQATLPDYKYKDVEGYSSNPALPFYPDEEFLTSISFVEENTSLFENIQFQKFEKLDFKKDFYDSNSTVILCPSYIIRPTELNIRPNIELNQNLKIKILGKVIERKVIGIINTTNSKLNLICSNNQGIVLSYFDYEDINKTSGINLSNITNIKLVKNSNQTNIGKDLTRLLKNDDITKIIIPVEELKKSTLVVENIVKLVLIMIFVGMLIFSLFYHLYLISIYNYNLNLISKLREYNFSDFQIKFTLFTGSLFPMFIGLLIAMVSLLYLFQNIRHSPNINKDNLIINWNLVIPLLLSVIFMYAFIGGIHFINNKKSHN